MKHIIDALDHLDKKAIIASHSIRRPWLTAVMQLFTHSCSSPAWFASALALIFMRQRGHLPAPLPAVLHAMTFALVAWGVGNLIRRWVKRPRPFHVVEGHCALVPEPGGGSMPSTHAATSVALSVALLAIGHPLAPWFGAWSALVVFSRYYLGVHYPSDLAAGTVLGVVAGLLSRAALG